MREASLPKLDNEIRPIVAPNGRLMVGARMFPAPDSCVSPLENLAALTSQMPIEHGTMI